MENALKKQTPRNNNAARAKISLVRRVYTIPNIFVGLLLDEDDDVLHSCVRNANVSERQD